MQAVEASADSDRTPDLAEAEQAVQAFSRMK